MIEKTHIRIAEEVAKRLRLKQKDAELLKLGSTRPDLFEEFPHHRGKEEKIISKILLARTLFLKGDDEAYVKLGEALHYIADKWTLRPRSTEKHTRWEQEIERQEIHPDERLKVIIENAPVPAKVKQFYFDLLEVLGEIVRRNDFSGWQDYWQDFFAKGEKDFSTVKEFETFANKDRANEVLERYSMALVQEVLEDLRRAELGKRPLRVRRESEWIEIPGGRFLPAITSDELAEMKENYSTPELDLNFAFRLCFAISHLVLTRDIVLRSEDWDWNETRDEAERKKMAKIKKELPKVMKRVKERERGALLELQKEKRNNVL